ncbi:MAG TPA: hypothetical protein VMV75_01115 [Sulfuricella sp.]|nr:hypothetical protein [Sulfuricella sp.]
MNSSKIADCVEILCQKGCREVSRVILALEQGEPVEEVGPLNPDERQTVLAELKSIMAVYLKGGTCQ